MVGQGDVPTNQWRILCVGKAGGHDMNFACSTGWPSWVSRMGITSVLRVGGEHFVAVHITTFWLNTLPTSFVLKIKCHVRRAVKLSRQAPPPQGKVSVRCCSSGRRSPLTRTGRRRTSLQPLQGPGIARDALRKLYKLLIVKDSVDS